MKRPSTNTQYKGDVKIKLKLKGKTIELNKHNNGLMTLSKAFVMYLTNNDNAADYIPQYIDLQYVESPDLVDDINDLSNWKTYLKKQVSLSGLSYTLSSSAYKEADSTTYQKNWVAVATARIPYSLLSSSVSESSTSSYRLFLLTDKLTNDSSSDRRLCYVTISAEELSKLEAGTEAQIEWQLQLVHAPVDTGTDQD